MKKPIAFIGAFSLAAIIFSAVILTSVAIKGVNSYLSMQSNATTSDAQSTVLEPASVLCIYSEGEQLFASVVTLDVNNSKCGFKNIELSEIYGNKTFLEIYKSEGLYPFCSAVMGKSATEPTFVKFNAETFIKTTDRFQKIVYNNEQDGELLLTGVQANEKLSAQNFGFFCSVLGEEMLKRNSASDFLFICNNLENNISLPQLSKLTK